MPKPSRTLLLMLMTLTALGEISTQLLLPALGELERGFAVGPGASLAALSVFVAAFGLGQLVLGPLSDRIGRRPVLIVGLWAYLLATGWMLLATDLAEFAAARALQGLGACSVLVLARAVVRDVWQAQAGPALALTLIGMLTSIVLAPMLGGLLTLYWGWQAPVLAAMSVGAVALLAVLFFYKESNAYLDPTAGRVLKLTGDYWDLLHGRSVRTLALTLACTYGAMFCVIAGSSTVYIKLLGLSAAEYGLTFAAIVSGLIAGVLFTQKKILQLGPQRIVASGVALVASGAALTLLVHGLYGLSLLGLSLPQVLVTVGGGMVLPASVAGAVIPNAHRAGLAAGFMGFSQMAGAVLAGVLLCQLQDGTSWPMVLLHGLFATAAFAAFHLLSHGTSATSLPASR